MWRLMASVKRRMGLRRSKKSARVVDESVVMASLEPDQVQGQVQGRGRWYGLSALLVIMRAPLAVSSCLAGRSDDMEDFWASGERPRTVEMDHLMVRDSLRYAIYV